MPRWPVVAGLWLGAATWTYAALAVLELRGTERDVTVANDQGYLVVPGYVPALTPAVLMVLVAIVWPRRSQSWWQGLMGGSVALPRYRVAHGRVRRRGGRWSAAAGTVGSAVLVMLVMLFGVPEIRSGF